MSMGNWPMPTVEPHEETAEIIRQVEFYFSDENLPHDAHLLGLTGGDGNGKVSFGHIHGFKKMRKYKPRARVIASLRQSTMVEIIDGKFIKRREPLKLPITVTPRINEVRRAAALDKTPWLTKGMMKPTGFEEYATDGPMRPGEYEEERRLFDPDEPISIRIERAVTRYQAKRKMHQITQQIFAKFLFFNGFEGGQRQFTGGLTTKDVEDYDKDTIEQMKANFVLSDTVSDGLNEDWKDRGTIAKWTVDFETVAKGFLSSQIFTLDWHDPEVIDRAVNLLRNFYNYLLYHDVCPEYESQIYAAHAVCNLAEKELPTLKLVSQGLPGNFNVACSTLHGGNYAGLYREPTATWDTEGDNIGLSGKDAMTIFATAVTAHGTEEQFAHLEAAKANEETLKTAYYQEHSGLEVISIEHASPDVVALYEDDTSPFKSTNIRTTGKLHCIRWDPPHAPPMDLPAHVVAERVAREDEKLTFVVEEDLLQHCYPGLKVQAAFGKLEVGIMWIDQVEAVYPTYFTWTLNETIREHKKPGSPKAWMMRAAAKRQNLAMPENWAEDRVEQPEGDAEGLGEEGDVV